MKCGVILAWVVKTEVHDRMIFIAFGWMWHYAANVRSGIDVWFLKRSMAWLLYMNRSQEKYKCSKILLTYESFWRSFACNRLPGIRCNLHSKLLSECKQTYTPKNTKNVKTTFHNEWEAGFVISVVGTIHSRLDGGLCIVHNQTPYISAQLWHALKLAARYNVFVCTARDTYTYICTTSLEYIRRTLFDHQTGYMATVPDVVDI